MYKILFTSGSLAQNGTEMFMMNVLRHIDKGRFHIDFCITSNEMTPNRVEAESLGCKIYVLPSRREGPIKSFLALWRFLKKHAHEYDAVHWNGGNLSSFIGFVLYKHFSIPVRIVHAHSSSAIGFHNIILHYFHRLFIQMYCTHFFACSTEAAKFFFRSSQSRIINNGIDVEKFAYDNVIRNEVREELSIPSDVFVIGHVGRFDDNKNHLFLIEIFLEIIKTRPHSRLLLVGAGVTFEIIKTRAEDLGISNNVIFTGMRTDVNRLMQAMDCFVMPSKFEGLPFVLVEAQCSGLHCVISDTISKDVELSNNIIFLPLNKGAKFWGDTIISLNEMYNRISLDKTLTEKGFSIKETVKYLEQIYSSKNII